MNSYRSVVDEPNALTLVSELVLLSDIKQTLFFNNYNKCNPPVPNDKQYISYCKDQLHVSFK